MLHFDTIAITDPHYSIARGAFAAPEHVYIEAHAAPGVVYTTGQGPQLYLYVSTIQRPVLLLDVSTPQELDLHLDLTEI